MARMSAWLAAASLFALLSVQGRAAEPLSIASQGYLFAGGKYSTVNGKEVMSGQIYAEYQIPAKKTHPYPIVMVHGAIQTGTNFTGTPDGREGWAQYFLRQGYAVYVVDQPGRARASYQPDLEGPQAGPDLLGTQQRFTAPEKFNLWPQAKLHTQWPGTGVQGDSIFDQFFASQVPFVQKPEVAQTLSRDALVALLDRIGPAVVMTHSQSGAYGWPVADARPDLVKALIEVEPSGPPVHDVDYLGAP
jgi:pimeloyl-ACP methyl ester carboxylesterase